MAIIDASCGYVMSAVCGGGGGGGSTVGVNPRGSGGTGGDASLLFAGPPVLSTTSLNTGTAQTGTINQGFFTSGGSTGTAACPPPLDPVPERKANAHWTESVDDTLRRTDLKTLKHIQLMVQRVAKNVTIPDSTLGVNEPGILTWLKRQNYIIRTHFDQYFITPLGYTFVDSLNKIIAARYEGGGAPHIPGMEMPEGSIFSSVGSKYLNPIVDKENVEKIFREDVAAILKNDLRLDKEVTDSLLDVVIKAIKDTCEKDRNFRHKDLRDCVKELWTLWAGRVPIRKYLEAIIRDDFLAMEDMKMVKAMEDALTADTQYYYRVVKRKQTFYEKSKKRRRNQKMQFVRVNKESGLLRMDCILSVEPTYERKDNADDVKDLEGQIKRLNEKVEKQSGEFTSDSTNPIVVQMEAQSFIEGNEKLKEVVTKLNELKARRNALDSEYTGRVKYDIIYDHPVKDEHVKYSTTWFASEEDGNAWLTKFDYVDAPMEQDI